VRSTTYLQFLFANVALVPFPPGMGKIAFGLKRIPGYVTVHFLNDGGDIMLQHQARSCAGETDNTIIAVHLLRFNWPSYGSNDTA
jgi:hypothetical protein